MDHRKSITNKVILRLTPERGTTLNADILKGRWHEIKGDVKAKWGKLTDNDLAEIAGDQEKLLGTLQKTYGYAREEIEREYRDFMKSRRMKRQTGFLE